MKRFCTYRDYDDNVFVLAEGQNAVDIPDEAADWVWQFAESEEEAVKSHDVKYDRLDAILQAGMDMPRTIGD